MISIRDDDAGQCDPCAAIDTAITSELEQRYTGGHQALHSGRYDRALIDFSWLVMSQPLELARACCAGWSALGCW